MSAVQQEWLEKFYFPSQQVSLVQYEQYRPMEDLNVILNPPMILLTEFTLVHQHPTFCLSARPIRRPKVASISTVAVSTKLLEASLPPPLPIPRPNLL